MVSHDGGNVADFYEPPTRRSPISPGSTRRKRPTQNEGCPLLFLIINKAETAFDII